MCWLLRQNVLDQKINLGQLSAILCVAWSKEPKITLHIALCMLSIHSPEYVVMVLVSIVISKTYNHF